MGDELYGNRGKWFSKHVMPVELDCNFVIDKANPNGLGQRSLKGPGIAQVFCSTSAVTPATFNGVVNNVADGYCQIFFNTAYYRYYGGFGGFATQVSGTPILVTTGTTKGLTYIIVLVGTTTVAQWQKLGLPLGIVPAVGVSFVAKATTTATGTGAIEVPHTNGSGIGAIEVVGDPNLTLNPSAAKTGSPNLYQVCNPYLIVRFMAQNAPPVAAQPADNSVCGQTFQLSNSSVQQQGE